MRSVPLSLLSGMLAAALLAAGAGARVPIVEAAAEAEGLLGAGEAAAALEALDRAVDAAWQASPLSFRAATIVEGAEGYGIYTPRADTSFRPGESFRVYVEPVGFAYGREGDMHVIGLDADLAIEHVGGLVLAEASDLFAVTYASRNRIREFHMLLSFTVPELRAGDYRAAFTVRDRHSDKAGRFALPFSVAE
jgi:ABC-type amino acid transport substrate-binding protein